MNPIGFIHQQQIQNKQQSPIVPCTFRHSLCLGETGSGKTSGFIYPNIQERIKAQHSLLIYDYKGKEHLAIKYLAIENNRLQDVIEIGKPFASKLNLLELFTENSFEKLMYGFMGTRESDWWEKAGVSLAMSVYTIHKLLSQINRLFLLHNINFYWKIVVQFDGRKVYTKYSGKKYSSTYSPNFTFKTLKDIFKDYKSFIIWLEGIDNLLQEIDNIVVKRLLELDNIFDNNCFEIISLYETLKIKSSDLSGYKGMSFEPAQDKRNSGSYGVLMTLQNVFKLISSREYLNYVGDDSININHELSQKKIIIFNTQSFSKATLNIISEIIFKDITSLFDSSNRQPISIFIDEAQKVLNKSFELPVDVLRDASVDVFLASQSIHLLSEAISQQRWLALDTNITQKYFFRDNTTENANLSDHYYFFKEKEHQAEPIFLDEQDLLESELQYQRLNEIHKKFDLAQYEIIKYNEALYERDARYSVLDIQSKHKRTVSIESKSSSEQMQIIKRFLKNSKYTGSSLQSENEFGRNDDLEQFEISFDDDLDDSLEACLAMVDEFLEG